MLPSAERLALITWISSISFNTLIDKTDHSAFVLMISF
jgi:hypothetical protein